MHAVVGGQIIELRVPYPMGFFTEGLEGRIDDPKAGWKGRALWATSGNRTPFHIEGIDAPAPSVPGSTPQTRSSLLVVEFQLRPTRSPIDRGAADWFFSSLAGSGVAIARHTARRLCSAASHSFIAPRCCSRLADFAASSTRLDA
jgi:hypothetical protein